MRQMYRTQVLVDLIKNVERWGNKYWVCVNDLAKFADNFTSAEMASLTNHQFAVVADARCWKNQYK